MPDNPTFKPLFVTGPRTGPRTKPPQTFTMVRNRDETGTNGTGEVLDGIVFPSGKCVVEWRGPTPCTAVWDNFDAFKRVHIDVHPHNLTEIKWH